MTSVLSIGNFDGLHQGHQKLLRRMTDLARQNGLCSVVISYEDNPAYILAPKSLPMTLLPASVKKRRLEELGIDQVELLHFDAVLAHTSAEEFLHNTLIPRYQPRIMVMGYDSHFGHQRSGDFNFLLKQKLKYGYDLEYVEPFLYQDRPLSSSLIRGKLLRGELREANQLLAQPYTLYGKVVEGARLGKELGFPTANLELTDPHQLIPQAGIYFCQVTFKRKRYFGLTDIGISPTLKQSPRTEVETYIIDFQSEIYGAQLEVALLKYLREEELFTDKAELKRAIQADLDQARALIRSRKW